MTDVDILIERLDGSASVAIPLTVQALMRAQQRPVDDSAMNRAQLRVTVGRCGSISHEQHGCGVCHLLMCAGWRVRCIRAGRGEGGCAARSVRARSRRFRSRSRLSWRRSEARRGYFRRCRADLERSGLFQPLDPASFLERISDVNRRAALSRLARRFGPMRWSLAVSCAAPTDGSIGAEFRLWDVTTRQAARRPALRDRCAELAARRAHHRRSGL